MTVNSWPKPDNISAQAAKLDIWQAGIGSLAVSVHRMPGEIWFILWAGNKSLKFAVKPADTLLKSGRFGW